MAALLVGTCPTVSLASTVITTGTAPAVNIVDASGNQTGISSNPLVVSGGGGGGGNSAASATGAAVPTDASYTGFNVGGNLVGISAANPLPITGSISATNPSVSATSSAVPAQATYLGASVAGTLTGLIATANGLKVDGSAVTQPVSGTVTANLGTIAGVSTAANQATEISSLATIVTNTGSAIPAGTNQIGHVITDTASVTAATGNVADNAADSGNPVKVGCIYATALTTYSTNGVRANCIADQFGSERVVAGIFKITGTDAISNFNFGAWPVNNAQNAASQVNPGVMDLNFDGTNWDRTRSIQGSDGTGVGITAVAQAPNSALTGAIVPCVSNAASTLGCKTSGAGNLYTVYLTATADSWLYVFNSTTAPTNGAVTAGIASGNYQDCIKVASGTTGSVGGLPIPERFAAGVYIAISSTACGTLTLATTGNLHGMVQ